MAGSLGRDANQGVIKVWLSFTSRLSGRRGCSGTQKKEETGDDWVFPLFGAMTCCQRVLSYLKSIELQPSGWNTIGLGFFSHLLAPSCSEASTPFPSVQLFISYWARPMLEVMFMQIFLLLWYHHSKFHSDEMLITEQAFHQRHAFVCISRHNSWHRMTLALPQRWFTAMGNKYQCLKKIFPDLLRSNSRPWNSFASHCTKEVIMLTLWLWVQVRREKRKTDFWKKGLSNM